MKSKRTLRWIPSLVIALVLVILAVSKLAAIPALVEIYGKIGLLPYLQLIGVAELLFAALFLWPPTMKTGFFLLTGYFGGAMAVELSHGTIFIAPALLLCLVWVAAYLRDRSLFIRAQMEKKNNNAVIQAAITQKTQHTGL